MERVSLSEKLSLFSEHWRPKIVAELNGQEVKVATPQNAPKQAAKPKGE